MGLGDTLKRALKATTTGVAKQTVRDTFSGIREGKPLKLLYRPIGAPSTGLISAIEIETQRRKEQTRFAEEAEQTEKQVALEAKLTEEEKMSRRKLDHAVFDEYASMNPTVWSKVVRPALSDRKGKAIFIGTPQGENHLCGWYKSIEELSGGVGL